MDIKLSISLLASNRKESLERCLDSLKPLLVKIPSELIIVLTGTDPKVREIAETYTPQVIPFDWCGDFSAARNAGLKAAQGEWFLYIDDDEWFDDAEEICQFFLSDEYRTYHSAHYIQRNYQNWDGTQYSDFPAFRMVQRLPETRFQGAIHEELSPRMEPCRFFETCVHHYGYVEDSGGTRKTARNIPILLQSIHDQPDKVKNYIQLAKEFGTQGDWKSAEEYCRKGSVICCKKADPHSKGWLQAYLAHLVSRKPGTESAISEIESILSQEHPTELICLILYQHLIRLYAEAGEPENSLRYGWKFEKLLNHMDENHPLWIVQSYGEFNEHYIKNPEHLYHTWEYCVASALKLQDWDAAFYFLKCFPWEAEDLLQRHYPCFEQWKEDFSSHFPQMLLDILEDLYRTYDIEYPQEAVPAYLLLQKALDDFDKGNHEEGLNLALYCMEHIENGYLQQLCLKELLFHEISIIPFAAHMDLGTWNEIWETTVKELPFTLNQRMQICEEEIALRYPLHSLCVKKHRLEQKLHKGFPLWDAFIETLKEYCQCILDFYRGLYKEEWLSEENTGFLPMEYRFARITLKALEELRAGQIVEMVRLFGDSLHIYPKMTGVVIEFIRQAACKMNDPAQNADTEFLQLAGQMKEALHTLLATGQTVQAAAILEQILPLLPQDLELIRYRQEFIRRKKS